MKSFDGLRTLLLLVVGIITSLSIVQAKPPTYPLAAETPTVEFTFVPRYGDSNGVLYGHVKNISSADYRVAVYIQVSGGWWNKPTWAQPTVPIHADGSWLCDITTGGHDQEATELAAFVVPRTYAPPLVSGDSALPAGLYVQAVAYTLQSRSNSDPILGLNYGPHREGQFPGGPAPTAAQLEEDIALMAQKVQVIRLYSSQEIGATLVAKARNHGLQVIVQAWIDTNLENNQREINAAIALAKTYPNVIAVLVGSEVLMRNDVSEATLIGYLQQVQTAVSIPVGYADDDYRWLNHPNLLDVVDWVGLDLYGFWNCQTAAQSVTYTRDKWQQVKATAGFENKRVLVLETGWPNNGYNSNCPEITAGTEAAQAQFVGDMMALAKSESMDLFLFETADEFWKCGEQYEPVVGCHWGLLKETRQPWSAWDELPDIWPVHLITPAESLITTNATPTFGWNTIINATQYHIQVDDETNFSSPIIDTLTSTPRYTPTTTLRDKLYYWRVQAVWGHWSDSQTVQIEALPGAAPSLNYATVPQATFCWGQIPWATHYEFEVDTTPVFNSPHRYAETVTADKLCATPSDLTEGQHYWRVRAKQGNRIGAWSKIETLLVDLP
ncbi:MAG TPA: hypothetical protein VHO69_00245 [Phototrophicaceae bacterium]|nr:hypothetical protein [Phototrophicaceae bacterium]